MTADTTASAPPAAASTAPATPPAPAPRRARPRHLRAQARPHVAMACLMGAAAAAEVATYATGRPGVVAAATAVVLFAAAVLLAVIKRVRLAITDLANELGWGWVWTVAGATATWLLGTIATGGLSWESTAALACGGVGLSLRWWQARRIPDITRPTTAPVIAPRPDADVLHHFAARWAATVSCPGGRLPGATLSQPTKTAVGEQYDVQLVPGKQRFSHLVNSLPTIASGLRVAAADLVPEAVPGDASMAKLTILTDSPLRKRTVLTELSDTGDGRLPLGPWGDGDGDACWRLYTENSMWGGVLIGGSGAGKSVLMTQIAVGAGMRNDTLVWFIDGQDGASSPALIDHADWAVGKDRAEKVLRAAADIIKWRSRQNVADRLNGFTPSPTRPGIFIQIDECHLVFEDEDCRELAEYIARVGRKVGVSMLCSSQYAGITTFGGSKALRSSIMQGNAVAMWTMNKGEKNFFPGLDLNPADLPPDLPGMGYLIDVTGSGKSAPFRGRDFGRASDLPADAYDKTSDDAVPYSAMWWLQRCPTTTLDTLSITAADDAIDDGYTNRHADLVEDLDKWTTHVRAMEQGLVLKDTTTPEKEPATNHNHRQLPSHRTRRHFRDFLRRPTDNRPGNRAETLPRPPAGLSTAETTVWQAVAAGPKKAGQIVDATPYEATYVTQQLKSLIQKGLIEQPKKFGPYQIADTTHASAA